MVTVAKDGPRRILAAVDAAAAALGLRPGQPVAQAQASVPGLVVADAAPEADAQALADLAGWCLRYAPVVQPDPPDGIFIDITGAAHLMGGEAALLDDLVLRLAQAGLAVQGGLADTAGAAWAAARFGLAIIPPGNHVAALAGLPIGALRLMPDTCAQLQRLGIARIGQLTQLPRAQLTLRFGPELVTRCDRAFGHVAEPLTALVAPETAHARRAFPEPLGHIDGLGAAVTLLAQELCRVLDRRQQGLRQLDAVFRRVDGRPLGLRIGTARASRDPHHCARLVLDRLAEIDPGFGIDEVMLIASRTESLQAQQVSDLRLDAEEVDETALGQLIDKLGIRLGVQHVFRVAPVESEYPERSVRRVAALAPASGGLWPDRLPRPSRLIDPPEAIQAVALAPDNPPAYFIWRRRRILVRHADGPERIRGEWWVSDAEIHTIRDYYRIEDRAGRRFWLFRDAPMGAGGAWWLHGFFS